MTTLATSAVMHSRGCYDSRVVLRYDDSRGALHPYIVHTEVLPDDGRPPYYITGGYHIDFTQAVRDFGERFLRDAGSGTPAGAVA